MIYCHIKLILLDYGKNKNDNLSIIILFILQTQFIENDYFYFVTVAVYSVQFASTTYG